MQCRTPMGIVQPWVCAIQLRIPTVLQPHYLTTMWLFPWPLHYPILVRRRDVQGINPARDFCKNGISQRINIVYQHEIHGRKIKDIETNTGVKYTTVLNIVHTYLKTGCIRPFLRRTLKQNLLQSRAESLRAQRQH